MLYSKFTEDQNLQYSLRPIVELLSKSLLSICLSQVWRCSKILDVMTRFSLWFSYYSVLSLSFTVYLYQKSSIVCCFQVSWLHSSVKPPSVTFFFSVLEHYISYIFRSMVSFLYISNFYLSFSLKRTIKSTLLSTPSVKPSSASTSLNCGLLEKATFYTGVK